MIGWGIADTVNHQDNANSWLHTLGGARQIASSQTGEAEIHEDSIEFLFPEECQRRGAGICRNGFAPAVSQDAGTLLLRRRVGIDEQHLLGHGNQMEARDGQGLHRERGHG